MRGAAFDLQRERETALPQDFQNLGVVGQDQRGEPMDTSANSGYAQLVQQEAAQPDPSQLSATATATSAESSPSAPS